MTVTTTSSPPSAPAYPASSNGANPLGLDRQEKILSLINQWYNDCKQRRNNAERQWYVNLAFYFGKQNVRLLSVPGTTNGFRLYTPKAPPWRVRLVINKVRSIARTELAKVTSQRPRFFVVPATSEDEDLIAARTAEKIFDAVYNNYKIKHILRSAEWWNVVCGNGFLKCYWDPGKVDEYSKQKGDFCIEAVTPFHIYVPDLMAEELEHQPYVIHASTKSLDWANAAFPQFKNKWDTTASSNDILDAAFLNTIGAPSVPSNQVLVLETWIKPGNGTFPNGGLVTIVGGRVVQVVEKFPYDHGQYPFMKLDNIPTGKFYTSSNIEDLVPLQREYNRTRSQIIEAKNLMAKPKLMAARGSIDAKQVNSEPGQVIYYQPGYPVPTQMDLQPLPQYVLQEVQQLQQDMDDMSGQHEISRGQNPSQVTAATALTFLKEQDDTKLSGTIESLELALEKLGYQTLSIVTQYWTTGRLVRMIGSDSTFDAALFKNSDIGGNHDVRVESGSALPQSKAAKQAFVMDLLKMGILPPEKGLEMLDIGGIEKIYEDYLTDVRQAQRENQKMLLGMQIQPNDFDNHQVHIEIHNKFRKGQQYESLSPEQQAFWQEHVGLHQAAMNSGLQPGGQMPPDPSQMLSQEPPVGNTGEAPPQEGTMQAPPMGGQ